MKVIWEQLIEAAKTYTDFKLKYYISAFNEKTIFLVCLFTVFFGLQIDEAIAAIFWQSASYVKAIFCTHRLFLRYFCLTIWLIVLKNGINRLLPEGSKMLSSSLRALLVSKCTYHRSGWEDIKSGFEGHFSSGLGPLSAHSTHPTQPSHLASTVILHCTLSAHLTFA